MDRQYKINDCTLVIADFLLTQHSHLQNHGQIIVHDLIIYKAIFTDFISSINSIY